MNIVFVCTGNTCRSPMAEALFRQKTKDYNEFCTVSSCGLAAAVGEPATVNAVIAMKSRDIDISSHRSRQINKHIIDSADVIICLSRNHISFLSSAVPEAQSKLKLLGDGIPDPYMGDENVYMECADAISQSIDDLLSSNLFFTVDKMQNDDIDEVVRMENENFSEPWSRDSFLSQICKEYDLSFVGHFLGKPVAYVCSDCIAGEIYIGNIAVDKKMRKRGFASMLMKRLIDFAEVNSCKMITLEVRESNIPAINFYKKFNFKSVGKRKHFYRKPNEDGIIMTREITFNERMNKTEREK